MEDKDAVFLIAMLFSLAFVLIGIREARKARKQRKKSKSLNYMVKAKCTKIKKDRIEKTDGSMGGMVYAPVYEFQYRGKIVHIESNRYSNVNVPEVGGYYDIYINPDNPQEYSDKMLEKEISMQKIIAFIFIGMGIFLALFVGFVFTNVN